MGKVQYTQKFRDEWSKDPQLKWVKKVPNDKTRVLCSCCGSTVAARHADLMKHAKTSKHKSCEQAFNTISQRKLTTVSLTKNSEPKKAAEGALALFVACHTSMNVVDHLSSLCSTQFADSKATEVQLRRTKCTQVIKNVLRPHFDEDLRTDVGDGKFSLIIDESTDISVTKLLGVSIRFVKF